MNCTKKASIRDLELKAIANEGARKVGNSLSVFTGDRTGRSPKDRYIVKDDTTKELVDFSGLNQAVNQELFDDLWLKCSTYGEGVDLYKNSYRVGSHPKYHLCVDVTTEYAWHQIFAGTMFLPGGSEDLSQDSWSLKSYPNLNISPSISGLNSDSALLIDLTNKRVLLYGLKYAGEIKKAMFSCFNYICPLLDILPMHCAAKQSSPGKVELFLGYLVLEKRACLLVQV